MDFLSAFVSRRPVLTALLLLLPGESVYLLLTSLFPHRATLEFWDVFSLLLGVSQSVVYLRLSAVTARQTLLVACVVLWAARLGLFLGARALSGFEDERLAKFRASRRGRVQWAAAQTAWMLVVLLPVWVGVNATHRAPIGATDVLGVAIFLLGLAVEAAADRQKAAFLARRAHRRAVCDAGLFRYARFPQYFGEITVWTGIAALAWAGVPGVHRVLLPLSPLFMYVLLTAVCIPIAERRVRKRAGEDELRKYLATSLLFPWPRGSLGTVQG